MNFSELYSRMNFERVACSLSGEEAYRYGTSSPGDSFDSLLRDPSLFRPGAADVRGALDRFEGELTPDDLAALLSPAAAPFLEEMARKAQYVTRKRFGNVMLLYAPLYLSNYCRSSCTYCGFSYENEVPRLVLSPEEILREGEALHGQGIRHLLLLTGEDYRNTPLSYIGEAAERLSGLFPSLGVEIYPLKEEEYGFLRERGVDSLTLYQETYDPKRYQEVHLRGVKQRMEYRLDGPDRAGRAGFRRINVGALLGLSDPAAEVFFVAAHARHLMQQYWRTQVLISLPRLRPARGVPDVPGLPDRVFVQYLTALRLYLPDAGLVLSTRESRTMRDHMADICITSMSAGSRTDPGGYAGEGGHEQFTVEDDRTVEEMSAMLELHGLEPVFQDWSYELK